MDITIHLYMTTDPTSYQRTGKELTVYFRCRLTAAEGALRFLQSCNVICYREYVAETATNMAVPSSFTKAFMHTGLISEGIRRA